ncbi:hypothetical protein [Streptomyces sp. WM6378]|uniref:hypothetical protein n=1 Tax=Streptomyces sp. WM6378 TaxID=1415557 RepID=UPI0006ADB874|nr:hypothetical protein [Streptomyces sp. WM6378]KOU35101.1 hypothetical protein ADK54_38605 [Streptomyces sp. WM6378]
MVTYRPSGAATANESIPAVGSPGEDLDIDGAGKADTGMVQTFRLTSTGTFSQLNTYYSGTATDTTYQPGQGGLPATGGRFGYVAR